jgi:enamine deaminase RidA (YjgF/YER057c/UK114 family)
MGKIDDRLNELNIDVPEPAASVANYVGYVITGNLVFISGQVTFGPDGNLMYQGIVGDTISIEEAQKAARLCGINILAQLKSACEGDLDRVVRCVKLGGFVNAVPGFENHPMVINGTSDLMVEVFGDKGKHARFAMGAGSLPVNVSVEVDAVFEIS